MQRSCWFRGAFAASAFLLAPLALGAQGRGGFGPNWADSIKYGS